MKKVFVALSITIICVLFAGCGTPATSPPPAQEVPTTTPAAEPTPPPESTPPPETVIPVGYSLETPFDVSSEQKHQAGEIQVAPGEMFSVSLTPNEDLYRVWEESPEIINEGAVEEVDYRQLSSLDGATQQVWTFRAADKGSCAIFFKTYGQELEVREWTYLLSVGVTSNTVSTFTANSTVEQTGSEASDVVIDFDNMLYTETQHKTFEVHGALEGEIESVHKFELDLNTGEFWYKGQCSFTGTLNGKSGTYVTHTVGWGIAQAPMFNTGQSKSMATIISGTGELANLRGTSNIEASFAPVVPPTDPPTITSSGTISGTLWFLD